MTDPIADMLTRVRNALAARHSKVEMPASKTKIEMARILKEEGYITNYRVATDDNKKVIKVYLRYGPDHTPVISHLERVSKPGRRVYTSSKAIPRVIGGMGINILTTSKGLMTGDKARRQNVGGEILCGIW
jgi:small subunit ribosomal protein S8